tara:strand:+ start:658 stop:891 length:234 start_codon:yes stop_codon:yes gene_type:complete
MIIPVRCVTCGKMLSDKWKVYVEMIDDPEKTNENTISIHISDYTKKSKELKAFEKLGIRRYCCRRHLLSHIELIDDI